MDALAPNTVLADRFRLEKTLASGGYGDVWKGLDTMTGESVAVKILRNDAGNNDPSALARMRQEAEMLQNIHHPNVVAVIGYFSTEAGQAIVMEYLDGLAIDQLLAKYGPITHEEAVAATREALSALAACHEKGVVHRDIKPENIVRCESPNGTTTKLVDFGIAKATELLSDLDSETGVTLVHTRAGGFMGTPRYAAPEQVVGDPFGPNIDLYSLGLVLAEWLSGRPRMDAETHGDVMAQVLSPNPIDLSDCPYRWREWLSRMIERNPEQRLQTAHEALAEFEELVIRLHAGSPFIEQGFDYAQAAPQSFSNAQLVPDFARTHEVPGTPTMPMEAREMPPVHEPFRVDEEPESEHMIYFIAFAIVFGIVGLALVLFF